VFERHGLRVAVVGYQVLPTGDAEVDRFIAGPAAAELAALSRQSDAVFVLVHWGDEYRLEPSAAMRRLGRWMVDQGASAVLGHHPHVVQPVESYRGRPIAYSLGNFVFDQEGYPTDAGAETERGVLFELRLAKRLGVTWRAVPTQIVQRHQVRLRPE
jgi:poly-gamma-glutamate synthesis protein (capsule biosynthesis protein)